MDDHSGSTTAPPLGFHARFGPLNPQGREPRLYHDGPRPGFETIAPVRYLFSHLFIR